MLLRLCNKIELHFYYLTKMYLLCSPTGWYIIFKSPRVRILGVANLSNNNTLFVFPTPYKDYTKVDLDCQNCFTILFLFLIVLNPLNLKMESDFMVIVMAEMIYINDCLKNP